MIETPEITNTVQQDAAVIHIVVPRAQIKEVMGPAIGEVMAAVAAAGVKPVGPVFSLHRRQPSDVFDFEVGVPVEEPFAQSGRVVPSSLPALEAARTIYRGPYEGLGEGWGTFDKWILSQGRATALPIWERYLKGPESSPNPEEWETELFHALGD